MPSILDYPNEAKFNIKSVSLKTGIQPVTLRAWERRYQILNPERAENGYRLYSERDVVLLEWIKRQLETGISISSAVLDFRNGSSMGIWPEAVIKTSGPMASKRTFLPANNYSTRLYQALVKHDEQSAANVFSEALASFDFLSLCEQVINPTLVEIGNAWYNGKILVATEHFASSFLRIKLLAIFQSLPTPRNSAAIMVGGAPGELHEIGPTMVAVLLRDAGFRVEYLGPDIPLDDLILYAESEHPKLIILSATLKESTKALETFNDQLKKLRHQPFFGYGGAAFNLNPELIHQVPGIFLGETLTKSLAAVKSLLDPKNKLPISA
ncbi:MAG: MerR family transcriptional regulator [Chloroflexi bacterium]|nr:MerR family transcriptional regulator [Chloroflexota bacterium]